MRSDLLTYYNDELRAIREAGAEFARKHPGVASSLGLDTTGSADPHVRRLLEGFAFLAARIHLRLDDDFPELIEGMFEAIYPHYLRPVPSMGIVELQASQGQGKLLSGYPVKRDTLMRSKLVDGVPCKFKTGWDTTLWPVSISEARWTTPQRLAPPVRFPGAFAACSLTLQCDADVEFSQLSMEKLRIHLFGGAGGGRLAGALYELLLNDCVRVIIRDPDHRNKGEIELPPDAIRPVGFAEDEALLPYPRKSFTGYRLLQEYFAMPEKFLFFDLHGLDRLRRPGAPLSKVEIVFLIRQFAREDRQEWLEREVQAAQFRLNCCPIINLFPHSAPALHMDHTAHEYRLMPDPRHPNALEIFSIERVLSSNSRSEKIVEFFPAHSQRFTRGQGENPTWRLFRRPSGRENDEGSDIWISFLDPTGASARPGVEAVTVRCTCTNRDLAGRLPFGSDGAGLTIDQASLITSVKVLRKPGPPYRPGVDKSRLWRLLSHLSLNYLSLVDDAATHAGEGQERTSGTEALQAILRLYNFSGSAFLEGQTRAIQRVSGLPKFARISSPHGVHFARGLGVDIQMDEAAFEGGGLYLFASVLDRFLGQYVALNSFTQLTVRTDTRKEFALRWPPRAGSRPLL